MRGKRISPETGVGLSGAGNGGPSESWGETSTVGISDAEMGEETTPSVVNGGGGFSAAFDSSAFTSCNSSCLIPFLGLGAGLGGTSSAAFKPMGGSLPNPSTQQ